MKIKRWLHDTQQNDTVHNAMFSIKFMFPQSDILNVTLGIVIWNVVMLSAVLLYVFILSAIMLSLLC